MNKLKNLSFLEVNNCHKYFIEINKKEDSKWPIKKILSKYDIIILEYYNKMLAVFI
jgi:hypothetical protein